VEVRIDESFFFFSAFGCSTQMEAHHPGSSEQGKYSEHSGHKRGGKLDAVSVVEGTSRNFWGDDRWEDEI